MPLSFVVVYAPGNNIILWWWKKKKIFEKKLRSKSIVVGIHVWRVWEKWNFYSFPPECRKLYSRENMNFHTHNPQTADHTRRWSSRNIKVTAVLVNTCSPRCYVHHSCADDIDVRRVEKTGPVQDAGLFVLPNTNVLLNKITNRN